MTYLSEEVGDFPPILGNLSLGVEHDLRPFYAYARETNDGHCTRDGRVGEAAIFVPATFNWILIEGRLTRVPGKLEECAAALERALPLFIALHEETDKR